jgi:hypothetical protein
MEKENRLTVDATGSNTDFTMNFIPKMDNQKLQDGYQYIINNIYKEKPYYKRIRELFLNYKPVKVGKSNIDFARIKAFFKSIFILGMLNKGRFEYWKFIVWTLMNKPNLFIDAITLAVYGYHFRTVYGLRQNRHKY